MEQTMPLNAAGPAAASLDGLLGLMTAGGPIMYVLAGLSVVALTIVFAKLLQFAALRLWSVRPLEEALTLWRRGDAAQAVAHLRASRHPAAQAMHAAMEEMAHGKPEPRVREEVERLAARRLAEIERGVRVVALVAMLSPLLGLLGTVIGMIDAFKALETAGRQVDPSILSGGIWVALLTTAAGLVVAVPAAAIHHWLEGICDRTGRTMEDLITRVFTQAARTNVVTREAA
jgi:biopolymer transport protein ExbB